MDSRSQNMSQEPPRKTHAEAVRNAAYTSLIPEADIDEMLLARYELLGQASLDYVTCAGGPRALLEGSPAKQ